MNTGVRSKYCRGCGHENYGDATVCEYCGTRLVAAKSSEGSAHANAQPQQRGDRGEVPHSVYVLKDCPSCGREILDGVAICEHCGASVGRARKPPEPTYPPEPTARSSAPEVRPHTAQPAVVYVMVNEAFKSRVKVGYTEHSVEKRRQELSSATGVPGPFQVAYVFPVPRGAGREAERLAHNALREFPRHKEFFRCSPTQAAERIGPALGRLISGVHVDIVGTREAAESARQSIREINEQLYRRRQVFEASRREEETRLQGELGSLKRSLAARHSATLTIHRLAAFAAAASILAVAGAAFGVVVAFVLLLLGPLWVPWILKRLPVSAGALPEFRVATAAIRAQHQQRADELQEGFEKERAQFHAASDRCFAKQKAAEDTLRFYGLSPSA